MTTDLKALIERQNKRRAQMTARWQAVSPAPSKTRAGKPERKKTGGLFLLLLALVVQAVIITLIVWEGFIVSKTPPAPEVAMAATEPVPSETPTKTAVAVLRRVCTTDPEGMLHVRFEPGQGSPVRGYLAEGETVQSADESTTVRGVQWLRLLAPIDGWVNAKFICKR